MSAAKPLSIAFIGIGVMGRSMVLNLIKAGHRLTVYTRTQAKAADVLAAGAAWAPTVAEATQAGIDVVATMVGFPKDVEEVYFGADGILAHARPGALLIDFTTTKPTLSKKIGEEAQKKGLGFVDAPVSGGDVGARNGTLTIMAGGEPAAFARAEAVFQGVGKTWVLQGPAGSGQHAKMCNQIAIASGMMGVMESLVYAKRAGLDPEVVLRAISGGAAASWSLSNLAPRVLKGDFNPGFFVEHFVKDMEIALEECERMGVEAPGLALARKLYRELLETGGGKNGTQALYLVLDRHCKPASQ